MVIIVCWWIDGFMLTVFWNDMLCFVNMIIGEVIFKSDYVRVILVNAEFCEKSD